MNNQRNVLIVVLFASFILCNTIQAMKRSFDAISSSLIHIVEEELIEVPELMHEKSRNISVQKTHNITCKSEGCRFWSKHEIRMRKHQEMHVLYDITPHEVYRCDLCDYMSNRRKDMDAHNQSHDGTKQYHCKVCDAWFVMDRSLKRHEKTSQKHQENSR